MVDSRIANPVLGASESSSRWFEGSWTKRDGLFVKVEHAVIELSDLSCLCVGD
jgi:hypothetical protein